MKSLLKIFGLAAIVGFGIAGSAAKASSVYDGPVYAGGPGMGGYCVEMPGDPRCGPPRPMPGFDPMMPRPGMHHRHHNGFIQPGFSLEFQFGNVYPQDHYRRKMIQKIRYCTNDMAVNKAHALGIHRIHAYAYPDYILIKGKKHGHRVEVALSRSRGCPIINY